ncbi:MAG: UDP-4-amino-4,6-dideoxy-N-acetyl-beta-L-altrosamine N-acetyltransferase [Oligoflexia bacterium]|nr:UDP-4-amino-4,6-dideoxy-N-acetyl-beta-L-altrosamine N-acetyltransferase [Oligoflexia bacterium]
MADIAQHKFEDCSLRELTEKDLGQVLTWRNSPRVRIQMYTEHIIAWEEHKAWFAKLSENKKVCFRLFEYQSQPVGIVQFTGIDTNNNTANWGFYMGREDLPIGTGMTLGFLGLSFGFEELGLNLVNGEAIGSNQASQKFHERLGFSPIETNKPGVEKDGRYEIIKSYQLTKENWLKNKEELHEKIFLK